LRKNKQKHSFQKKLKRDGFLFPEQTKNKTNNPSILKKKKNREIIFSAPRYYKKMFLDRKIFFKIIVAFLRAT